MGLILILLWLVSPIASSIIAKRKGFHYTRWGCLALAAGPLATIYFALKEPSDEEAADAERQREAKATPRALIVPSAEEIAAIQLEPGATVEGLRAQIEIQETGIKIRRDPGSRNLLLHGLVGEKSIAYRSISAVQLRMPGEYTSGCIQFSIVGGVESRRGIFDATTDENTVMFVDTQSAGMIALRNYLDRQIERAHEPRASFLAPSVADELAKLADLRDRQVLSDEEFEQQKAALLRSTVG